MPTAEGKLEDTAGIVESPFPNSQKLSPTFGREKSKVRVGSDGGVAPGRPAEGRKSRSISRALGSTGPEIWTSRRR